MTINSFADNREAREVWANLPLEVAYPIGSRWTHSTYGETVFTVRAHRGSGELEMVGGDYSSGSWWPRSALDNYGNPVPAESTPPEETRPLEAGDRVKVTVTRDYPARIGKLGKLERIDPNDPRLPYLVHIDDESYAVWVNEVERVEESTPPTPPTPAEPAVGDRVTIIESPDDRTLEGQEATLNRFERGNHLPYRVELDGGRMWWVRQVAPATPLTLTPRELESKLEEARREGRQAATREFDEWKSMAQVTAHQYAQDNSLCQEFDRCMVAIGLEPRDSWEGEEYCVTVTYDIHVTAHNSDAAESEALNRIRNDAYLSPVIEAEPA